MNISDRISAFVKLGKFLQVFSNDSRNNKIDFIVNEEIYNSFDNIIKSLHLKNSWFIKENVRTAISAIAKNLNEENLNYWIEKEIKLINKLNINSSHPKTIAVIMAGNIPLVGFHDFLCVLITGNRFLGKLSSDDNYLLPIVADILKHIEPEFNELIYFTNNKLDNFDAIIATGSNNTSRYFDYYFGKYPHIIRKNRYSFAVLNGQESDEDLKELCKDVFLYFGLGCRNISKIFIPNNYSFTNFFNAAESFAETCNNNKYRNTYTYNKSLLLINKIEHLDNGFLLLKEDTNYSSPVSVLNYEHYNDISVLQSKIKSNSENIQCIVTNDQNLVDSVKPGQSQFPVLWDYADRINTITFLLNI
jgi:hypothetical protein